MKNFCQFLSEIYQCLQKFSVSAITRSLHHFKNLLAFRRCWWFDILSTLLIQLFWCASRVFRCNLDDISAVVVLISLFPFHCKTKTNGKCQVHHAIATRCIEMNTIIWWTHRHCCCDSWTSMMVTRAHYMCEASHGFPPRE